MEKLLLSLLLTVSLISCTTDSSEQIQKLDPSLLAGQVVDRNGDPIPDVDIYVIYISESLPVTSDIVPYPNPFTIRTTIQINLEDEKAGFQYEMKAVSFDGTQEIEVESRELNNADRHIFIWEPEEGIEKGIYILKDNLGNEGVVLYAPTINDDLSFDGNIQPRTAGSASGGLIGEEVAITNENGAFVFEKDMLIETDNRMNMIRTDETGLHLGRVTISDTINVVAYVDENYYSFKEIDYKKDKVFDLKLEMP